MIVRSSGVLLASTPYSETSLILKVYTEEFGLNSFLFKGARSKKNKRQQPLFRPFSIVEVVHYRGKSELHLVKEFSIEHPLHHTAASPEKGCISLFLSEFLFRILDPDIPDRSVYQHIYQSIKILDLSDNFINFHLQFLLGLTGYLGIYPSSSDLLKCTINYQGMTQILTETSAAKKLLDHPDYSSQALELNNDDRKTVLKQLINYYAQYLNRPLEIRSLAVLETVFND